MGSFRIGTWTLHADKTQSPLAAKGLDSETRAELRQQYHAIAAILSRAPGGEASNCPNRQVSRAADSSAFTLSVRHKTPRIVAHSCHNRWHHPKVRAFSHLLASWPSLTIGSAPGACSDQDTQKRLSRDYYVVLALSSSSEPRSNIMALQCTALICSAATSNHPPARDCQRALQTSNLRTYMSTHMVIYL